MTNGYKTIDFGGAEIPIRDSDHETAKVVIPGIYEEFEGATKPIIVSNMTVDTGAQVGIAISLPYANFVTVVITSYGFSFTLFAYDPDSPVTTHLEIVINDDDEVYAFSV